MPTTARSHVESAASARANARVAAPTAQQQRRERQQQWRLAAAFGRRGRKLKHRELHTRGQRNARVAAVLGGRARARERGSDAHHRHRTQSRARLAAVLIAAPHATAAAGALLRMALVTRRQN